MRKNGQTGKQDALPAIAVGGRQKNARLLRDLLAWSGSGGWQVCRLTGRGPGGRALAVAAPGDLSWELLEQCVRGGTVALAVLDLDDPVSRYWREENLTPSITYSENKDQADLTAKNLTVLPDGDLRFEVLCGDSLCRVRLDQSVCTLYEALNVMACALAAGVSVEVSAAYFSGLSEKTA